LGEAVSQEGVERLVGAAQRALDSDDAVSALAQANAALCALDRLEATSARPLRSLRAQALGAMGRALYENGRHGEAHDTLRLALDELEADDLAGRAAVLRQLSVNFERMGDPSAALDLAVQALDVARGTGDDELVMVAELSVGVGRSRCGDPVGGLSSYRRVLDFYEATGRPAGCMSVLNNMGINLKNLGRLDEALSYQERAAAIATELGLPASAGIVRSNMGETLWRLGRSSEAAAVLRTAIEDLERAGRVDGEINARVSCGRALADLGDEAGALAELERALQMVQDLHVVRFAPDVHQALAGLHKQAGRFELALAHFEAYHHAERVNFEAASDKQVAALRVRLEVEEARHEAEVERLRAVEIRRAHEELKMLHDALVAADIAKTELIAQLDEQSQTDALTGLLNRRGLEARLQACVAESSRTGRPLCLAMCDVDSFKRLNDEHGHLAGDRVLRELAGMLRRCCRASDVVARYGGEEFCIALPDTDLAIAVELAERLRHEISSADWTVVGPGEAVTISIGVSKLPAGADHALLLASADAWMYAAKRTGRNQVCWAAPRGDGAAAGRAFTKRFATA